MARTRLSIAKADIIEALDAINKQVLQRSDLEILLRENREFWRLAKATTVQKFYEFLASNTELEKVSIKLPFRPTDRYLWRGGGSIYELVQSLRPKGYISHYTAMRLHELTDQIPKTFYINSEQKARGGGGQLSQRGIDLAFRNKCRVTNNRTVHGDIEIVAVNGGNTDNLGTMETKEGAAVIRFTNVERTLIDATVRPVYCGGTTEVANAFEKAHGKFSVNTLVSYLRKLNYTYPYHQAIGFYLERTGLYTETQLSLLKSFEIEYDFYLANAMKSSNYNERWKLFIPKGI